nr:2-hydroxyacyl-CoA dehydratase family protein [Candidatus Sigynarchaeota archaeon]
MASIGWLCSYTPIELILAAGFTPFRITGHVESPRAADTYMSANICQFVRSVVDMVTEGKYDHLRGVVFVNSCDAMRRLHDVWKRIKPNQALHMIDLPVNQTSADLVYFEREVTRFRSVLDQWVEKKITDKAIVEATRTIGRARALYQELLALRKEIPPRIGGIEMKSLTENFFSGSIDTWIQNTEKLLATKRAGKKTKATTYHPRLLLEGCPDHSPGLISLIQESEMDVVYENTCSGSRFFDIAVKETGIIIADISKAYFHKPTCARMMQLDERATHIIEKAKEFKVDGIINYSLKFCDTYQYDVPALKKRLQAAGLNVLAIESDGTASSAAQLKTRFEAFKEVLMNKRSDTA